MHSYFVRITPRDALSFEDIELVLSDLQISQYFICYEEASRPHYHLCLFSQRGVENLRYQLKSKVNAQVYISGKEIEDKVKAVAYCMKDGKWKQKNMDINTVLMASSITHKKQNFDTELKELIDNTQGSIQTIVEQILDLHVKYNRKIYRQHIKALVELIRLKKEGNTYRQQLVKYFIDEY